ncbi:MAG TPA: AsmA-like C-terminal region-containing protein [Candidatus Paceibacterota bacterium]|nr:AsmA-like C-terminal region-containing protein [Verrucomicrobiota bacterium]HRZ44810.1 AsmA-like C-terminal region-containing protein [Candidatus Paceibacterota bacterium]HRZ93863.1 AsmA-like C-terminal region-containing protein [Candidatus Paceibacterota bacterium]
MTEMQPQRRRKPPSLRRRVLLVLAAALAIGLAAIYLLVHSQMVLRSLVLPRVAEAIGAQIEVDRIALHRFTRLELDNLRIRTTGAEPLANIKKLRLQYALWPTLRGRTDIRELYLDSPDVYLLATPAGSNLDPVLQKLNPPLKPGEEPPPSATPVFSLAQVKIDQGRLRRESAGAAGERQRIDLSQIAVSIDRIGNSASGKLSLTSQLRLEQSTPAVASSASDRLAAGLEGSYEFKLDGELRPVSLTGSGRLRITEAGGAWQDMAQFAGHLECDLNPTEVRQILLRFEREGNRLGQVRLYGPLDWRKNEARLRLELTGLDRYAMNLAGAPWDLRFGVPTLNASNILDISQQGNFFSSRGTLAFRQLSIQKSGQQTPALDLDLDYQFNVDRRVQTALIQRFSLLGRQGTNPLVRVNLENPMNLSWGNSFRGFKESTNRFAISNLDLQEWAAFLGPISPAGRVNAEGTIIAQKDGQDLTADVALQAANIGAQWGTNRFQAAQLALQARGSLEQFQKLHLDPCRIEVKDAAGDLLASQGAFDFDRRNGNLRLRASLELDLPAALRQYPIPQLSIGAGAFKWNGLVSREKQALSIVGSLSLTDFTGRYADLAFDRYQALLNCDLELKEDRLRIQRAHLDAREGFEAGGTADVNGVYDLTHRSLQIAFSSVALNHHLFGPFLQPYLSPYRLTLDGLHSSGQLSYDPAGTSSVQGEFRCAGLQIQEAQHPILPMPFTAQLLLDASLSSNQIQLPRFLVHWPPSPKARNELRGQGNLSLSPSNRISGQLAFRSDGLDATPILSNLLAQTSPGEPASKTPDTNAPSAAEPVSLPFQPLTISAQLDRVHLGDIAATNWQATVRIDGGRIQVSPMDLNLNGAPVRISTLLDLGAPLPAYEFSLQAARVPIEPIANTFMPDQRGQYQGDLSLQGAIQGRGFEGDPFRQSLAGQADLTLTNLVINVVEPRWRQLLQPISVILRLPDLLNSPITSLDAQALITNGVVDLKRSQVLSPAFRLQAQGPTPLASRWGDSALNLPVAFEIHRTVAEKAQFAGLKVPPDAAYVRLPDFVRLGGTLGNPETKVNEAVLVAVLGQNLLGLPATTIEGAGQAIGNLGDVLKGEKKIEATNILNAIRFLNPSATPAAAGTNAPSAGTNAPAAPTNAPITPLDNLFQRLRR